MVCYSCGIIYLIVNKHVFEHRLLWITEQLCCCKYIFSFISIHSTMVKLILCFVPLQISVLCISYRWCKETSISVDPNMCDPAWILIYRLRVCAQFYLYACLNNAPCVYACGMGPEFCGSTPMEIDRFSPWGILQLLWRRRWRFLLVFAQPVNGACLQPSIT